MTGPAPQSTTARLQLPFRRAGRDCAVTVTIVPNEDPVGLGCYDCALGFPVCRAEITPPARAYADAVGWIQLVASTDLGGRFEMDPFQPFGTAPHPFCFYGFAPVLVDAPHRDSFPDMDWVANSFLAEISGPDEAAAILGFSWGFTIRDGEIGISPLEPLAADEDWDRHLPTLRADHPTWAFAPGIGRGGEGRTPI